MSQINQYANTSFYNGIPGKPFAIKTCFDSFSSMLTDLEYGWRSPITTTDYVIISYGLSDYNLSNFETKLSENKQYLIKEKTEQGWSEPIEKSINFNGTLWQKIIKTPTDIKDKPIIYIESANNIYCLWQNGMGYQLIADLNAIPSFNATTKTLNPSELPKVENKGTDANIDLEFSIPRAANFHWLDSIKGEDGKNLMLINADGSLKDNLKINNIQAEAKIQIDDFVIHRPTGIMYRCYENNDIIYLKVLSSIATQTDAIANSIPFFNENGEINQPSVELNWKEYLSEDGYNYNPLYQFNLPKMPKIKMYAYPASVNSKVTASESYYDKNDINKETLAFNLQIPLEEIDSLKVSCYGNSLEELPKEVENGSLGLVYEDQDNIILTIYLENEWQEIGNLSGDNLSNYGDVIGLTNGDSRKVFSADWLRKHFSWKDARNKIEDKTSDNNMIDFLIAPEYDASLITNEHDVLFTTNDQHLYIVLNKEDEQTGGMSLENYAVVSPVNEDIDNIDSHLPIGSSLIRHLSNNCFTLTIPAQDWFNDKIVIIKDGQAILNYEWDDPREYFANLMIAPVVMSNDKSGNYDKIQAINFTSLVTDTSNKIQITITADQSMRPSQNVMLYIWRFGERSIVMQPNGEMENKEYGK